MTADWEAAFEEFLARPRWDFLAAWARERSCLPVYVDWTHALGICPDGTVLSFAHDPDPGDDTQTRVVTDLRLINVAVHAGMKMHPWLGALLPRRPADAVVCPSWRGTGSIPQVPQLVCKCGGAGWLPPAK